MRYLLTLTDEYGKKIKNIGFVDEPTNKWKRANYYLMGHLENALLSEWDDERKVWGNAQWWKNT